MSRPKFVILGAFVVLGSVALTYSNHFQNSFHFDDFHTITNNVRIRDLGNFPAFFTDAATASALPANRNWRPLVTLSLAIDYRLGGGYKPFWFHLSTFLWFLTQLVLMYWLFEAILSRVRPDPGIAPANMWVAWFAVAWYGLHPAIAETVNYIIQRADLMSTCGVVAGLVVYARFPQLRRSYVYLVPVIVALLCKAPALIFPFLLLAYNFLFEEEFSGQGLKAAAKKSVPALAVSIVFAWLQSAITPKSFTPGASSAYAYLITQPYVMFRYFASFLLPIHLSADTDLSPLPTILSLEAFGGFVFLAVLLFAIWATARHSLMRPVAFGLVWFVLALVPTSTFPLAEVENDHRMFFPFVGLVFAATWTGVLLLPRQPLRAINRVALAVGLGCVLLLCALGTRRRNEVWHTEESLWQDVIFKSPRNGRGLMNYGLTLMNRGDSRDALMYFERALLYTPNYPTLEINLGIANSGLNRDKEAEMHFLRARQLAPQDANADFYYARWLKSKGRTQEAVAALKSAIADNPMYMDARYLLLQAYAEQGPPAALKSLAEETLKLAPNDPLALRYSNASAAGRASPESWLDQSLRDYQAANYMASIQDAREALRLRPDYAEAYNNIAAAYQSMGRWDEAIQAAREALRIKPDFELARNNLAWSESQKKLKPSKDDRATK